MRLATRMDGEGDIFPRVSHAPATLEHGLSQIRTSPPMTPARENRPEPGAEPTPSAAPMEDLDADVLLTKAKDEVAADNLAQIQQQYEEA